MKTIRKKSFAFITLISMILTLPQSAFATDLTNANAFFGSGFPTSIIMSMDYWEESTVSSLGYSSYFATSRVDYAGLSDSDIGFSGGSTESAADLRVYAGDYYWETWEGKVRAWNSSGVEITLDPTTTGTWYKSHLLLNSGQMVGYTAHEKQATVGHELGHVLSLRHQDLDAVSIMKQETTYAAPQSLDSSNLAWKY